MGNPVHTDSYRTSEVDEQPMTRAARMRGIRLTLTYSTISAVFNNITAGAVVTGYALFLGATNYHIGLLSSVPNFAQAMQAFAPAFTEKFKRRKPVFASCNLLSYLLWIPIAFIPFYLPPPLRPWAMIALVGLSGIITGFGNPAGVSWITDLVPPDMLGRFYARVNILLTITGMLTAIAAGRYVDVACKDHPRYGFASILVFAVLIAVVSNGMLRMVPEPEKKSDDSLGMVETFKLPFRDSNFRNLMIFFAVRSMAIMIAAPFFSVYWIKELKFSYSYIAVISTTMSLSSVASYQLWGYLSDKYGNKPITKMCWSGMCFIPITWFFVSRQNYVWAAPLASLWGGFFGAGVAITQLNLRAKIAPEENRSVYMGCFNGVVSTTSAIGPVIGGALATLLKDVDFMAFGFHINTLKSLFLVSATCRMACSPLLWLVKEADEMPAQFILRQIPARNPIASFFHLIRFSRSARTSERKHAARALGSTRTRLAVEELIAALEDSSWDVRREAARSLGDIGDARAVDALIACLNDKEADIVEEVAESLGKIGDPSALAPLVMLLDSDRPSVRRSAVSALGSLGSVKAAHYLERMLDRETDQSIYVTTVDALSRIGGASAIHYLRNLLRNSKPGIFRRQLVNSISNLLGEEGEFYKLLETDEMTRETMVGRIFAAARRRLTGRKRDGDEEVDYIEVHLDAAIQRYETGEYAGSVACLRKSVTRALLHFAASARGARWLASHDSTPRDIEDGSGVMGTLLSTNDRLKRNVGFLQGLDRETRSRQPFQEEMLLSIFALQQIGAELVMMRRGRTAINDP